MKKIIMLACLAISTLVISCGKDENQSIEGTWYYYSATVEGKVQLFSDCMQKSSVTFAGNNEATFVGYSPNNQGECVKEKEENGTYSISGNEITILISQKAEKHTFSIDGNTMTITNKEIVRGQERTSVFTLKRR